MPRASLLVFIAAAVFALFAILASYTTLFASITASPPLRTHFLRTMVNSSSLGDVYFLSHGGPPSVEQTESPPYKAWRKFGKTITANPPKGIVVVSAHWESDQGLNTVNSNILNPLIYDFYGFPKHFYQLKFASKADPELQEKVVGALKEGGIPLSRADRGLDHGVWIPFKAAFGEDTTFPLVQVSLPASADPVESIKLGQALSKLRAQGYAIVGTGQVVHNLRDLCEFNLDLDKLSSTEMLLVSGKGLPYTGPFLKDTSKALSSSDYVSATLDLTKHPLYKKAHPTDEHFFPLLVAVGATSSSDQIEEIYKGVVDIGGRTVENDGLGWGMWRWTSAA
ncbi:extradiol ring-cleavage dioxygenase [Cryptococcus wingfieldii CBS 7118]|uniref:Extradiol ring-cleavage dioxygenase n=1 Tax=Cryptococcus wingfieldii CBS 7118 TaxID=1295528 RepID=A0A1E3J1J1_9TREE|nr:extradiol ring-cleavage dioxygenase [Cryptococcus wingfieldii CBS 7118]ODN94750.1 extradiol ring-cleavage dioxygenase [Cryptococcus wingfieldii CBS 7118]